MITVVWVSTLLEKEEGILKTVKMKKRQNKTEEIDQKCY